MTTDYTATATDSIGIESVFTFQLHPEPVEIYSVRKPSTVGDPSFHPDGTQVIFTEHVRATYRIVTISVGATSEKETLYSGQYPIQDPTWSADGFFVLFTEQKTLPSDDLPYGTWRIRYINEDGDVITIVDDGNANMHPVWVSASQIAFQVWQNGATPSSAFEIHLCDLAGRGVIDLGEGEYPRLGRL